MFAFVLFTTQFKDEDVLKMDKTRCGKDFCKLGGGRERRRTVLTGSSLEHKQENNKYETHGQSVSGRLQKTRDQRGNIGQLWWHMFATPAFRRLKWGIMV